MICKPIDPKSSADESTLRLVLITNGLRPASEHFLALKGQPIGIVSWHDASSGRVVTLISLFRPVARLYARLRRRRYASLAHFCREHQLRYASIHKSQPDSLNEVLNTWKPELVITSGCPLVPMNALGGVRHGGINLHPSSLPAYRGPDPIAWQVINQVEYLGVSVHRLVDRYDAGAILAKAKVRRPQGESRQQLTRLLEGHIGFELLNRVVDNMTNSEEITQHVQPDSSPTRAATKLTLHAVGNDWALDDLSVNRVWDIVKYYDQCPDQWLALTGWRRFVSWKPVSIQYVTGHDFVHTSSCWRVNKTGLTILLMNQLAIITLSAVIRV